jgi:hypothetical protein
MKIWLRRFRFTELHLVNDIYNMSYTKIQLRFIFYDSVPGHAVLKCLKSLTITYNIIKLIMIMLNVRISHIRFLDIRVCHGFGQI